MTIKKLKMNNLNLVLGQIISAEENRDLPSKSTLNEKMSDIIGETSLNFNENVKLTNSFLLDQNLENFNQNQIDLGIFILKQILI